MNNMVMAARPAVATRFINYGLLSENAAFAAAVESPDLLHRSEGGTHRTDGRQGDARVAAELDLPSHPVPRWWRMGRRRAGGALGFPVMLKAAAGGGGRGMQSSKRTRTLPVRLPRPGRSQTFGSDGIYLERFYPPRRRGQVLGDGAGAGIHYLTRDCSVQRRHQKLIEEAPRRPSKGQTDGAWRAVCRGCGEARVPGRGDLRVPLRGRHLHGENTRLQVEHPVTEMVTGVDLWPRAAHRRRRHCVAGGRGAWACDRVSHQCRGRCVSTITRARYRADPAGRCRRSGRHPSLPGMSCPTTTAGGQGDCARWRQG